MKSKITKWGNSYGIRISKKMIEEMKVVPESPIYITKLDSSNFGLKVLKKRVPIDEMVGMINKSNKVQEVDWGSPLGNEVW